MEILAGNQIWAQKESKSFESILNYINYWKFSMEIKFGYRISQKVFEAY